MYRNATICHLKQRNHINIHLNHKLQLLFIFPKFTFVDFRYNYVLKVIELLMYKYYTHCLILR